MPYKNIHWVKLEKRLLEDPRWYMMSEKSQLNFIKLILLCATLNNKIPKNFSAIKKAFKTEQSEEELQKSFEEIKAHFPKVKENKGFFYIKDFNEHSNWVLPGNSQGTPKELPGKRYIKNKNKNKNKNKIKNKIKNKNKNKNKDKEEEERLLREEMKDSPVYQFITQNIYFKNIKYPARLTKRLIDHYKSEELIVRELRKMDEWLLANPKREKKNYERFILNWMKREEQRIDWQNQLKKFSEGIGKE